MDFHHKLGLSPKIVRKLGPGTSKKRSNSRCEFCRERVGTFVYNKETIDKDIFRRHAHCHCTLEYFPGDGKKQNSWSKRWKSIDEDDKIEKRKRMSENSNKLFVKTAHAKIRQSQRNISNEDIEKAIKDPIYKENIVIDDFGRKNQKIIGEFTTVVINPDTMEVITTYSTKESKRRKYLKR